MKNLKGLLVKTRSEKVTLDNGILSNIRVLDFTRVLAGPYATRILADFGAQVIKVQSAKTAKGAESNQSGYFRTWNRNKRSITLDMTYPEAKAIALKLAAISDVVIENFSPRVMSNWEIDYEKLKVVKPDLIMVSMSGAGHDGSWKNIVALGPTVQALSGLTFLTSFNATSPIGLGYSLADIISGLYGTISVLMALEYRDKTGNGQYIDLSEYEVACTLLGPTFLNLVANRKVLSPQGNRSDHIPAAPYGCYKCLGKDRWCVIAVFSEVEWLALCKIFGNPNWSKEERFSTMKLRKLHINELNKLLEQHTAERKAEDLVQKLQEAGIPSGVVQNAQDLANDPHLKDRKFFELLENSRYGKTISDKSPIKLCEGKANNWRAAPLLGEDNRYVFIEVLGMHEEELSEYVKKGVIA